MRSARPVGVATCALTLVILGCGRSYYLRQYEHDAAEATKAIAAAKNDGERAKAYATRGRAYSEKARYSRAFQLIPPEEYRRLFDLAVRDHDRAISLAPSDANAYVSRGRTYYDRAGLELQDKNPEAATFFGSAKADFTRALDRVPGHAEALDMRGLIDVGDSAYDEAIADFTREMSIDAHLGKLRLADTYCLRGSSRQRAKTYDLAIADYEKSIALEAPPDSCECQPDGALAQLYLETKQYDQSWRVIHTAGKRRAWIAPETRAALEKASGRRD
jgi:tetratricopeptide (TPR) repeat protein